MVFKLFYKIVSTTHLDIPMACDTSSTAEDHCREVSTEQEGSQGSTVPLTFYIIIPTSFSLALFLWWDVYQLTVSKSSDILLKWQNTSSSMQPRFTFCSNKVDMGLSRTLCWRIIRILYYCNTPLLEFSSITITSCHSRRKRLGEWIAAT